MPVLPLIDALILMGWTALLLGFVIKALWISTSYRPLFFGMTAMDFLLVAGICLLFALTLAARTWVKMNEPKLLARRGRGPEAEDLDLGLPFENGRHEGERHAGNHGDHLPMGPGDVRVGDRQRGAAIGR